MRMIEKKEDVASNKILPSEKYKARELTNEDMLEQGINGNVAKVSYLPVAEAPPKHIYGELDRLKGSPAREMTDKLENGELPLGKFSPAIKTDKSQSHSKQIGFSGSVKPLVKERPLTEIESPRKQAATAKLSSHKSAFEKVETELRE